MHRTMLRWLVFALPLLVVVFAVLLSGAALSQALGDLLAARVISSVAVAVAMGIAVDLILLVGLLGLKALADIEELRLGRRRRIRRRKKGRRDKRRREKRHRDHDGDSTATPMTQ